MVTTLNSQNNSSHIIESVCEETNIIGDHSNCHAESDGAATNAPQMAVIPENAIGGQKSKVHMDNGEGGESIASGSVTSGRSLDSFSDFWRGIWPTKSPVDVGESRELSEQGYIDFLAFLYDCDCPAQR